MKILVAVDGSRHALAAVQSVIDHAGWYREKPSVELVTVHLPVPSFRGMGMVVSRAHLERYYRDEGEERLELARKKLAAAGIPFATRILVGPVAELIVEHAQASGCDLICIGSRGLSDLGKALLGSTATKVLHLSKLPVLLVSARSARARAARKPAA
jgi:nucleotide-binding universal stress UspA family protein